MSGLGSQVRVTLPGSPAAAWIWSVGGVTAMFCRRYMRIGLLVPAGSVKVNEPLSSVVMVPITVQILRSCEARTLHVWPGWPAPLRRTDPPRAVSVMVGVGFAGKGTV